MRSAPQVVVTAELRDEWIASTDAQLLAQSQTDRYRASGPGGQHRNKTESAVRVRHTPSGVTAMSEDSRSQGENRDRALRRLREKFALELRTPVELDGLVLSPTLSQLVLGGTARLGAKTRLTTDYLQGMAQLLDVFVATGNEVAATAGLVGLTTGATSKLLTHDDNVAKVVNQHRVNAGLRPLR